MPVINRLLIAFVVWEVLVLFTLPVRSQEQPPPRERALMERVSAEINSNLVCATNVATLQDKIKELEAKLKAAEKLEDAK